MMPPHPAPLRARPALPSRGSVTQHTYSRPTFASSMGGTHRGPGNNHTIEKDGSPGFHGLPINDDPTGAGLLEWALRIQARSGTRHVSSQSSLPSVMSLGRTFSNASMPDPTRGVLTGQGSSGNVSVLASITQASAPCIVSTTDIRRRESRGAQRPIIASSGSSGSSLGLRVSRLAPSSAGSRVTIAGLNVDLCLSSKGFVQHSTG